MPLLARGTARTLWVATRALLLLTLVLGLGYTGAVTAAAQLVVPGRADGSLVHDRDGRVVGSSLLGQSFTDAKGVALPGYFQSRPSAAGDGYDGRASGGSRCHAWHGSAVCRRPRCAGSSPSTPGAGTSDISATPPSTSSRLTCPSTSWRSEMTRGRLRVLLGAAPGVGKTCTMLEEGRRLRADGRDVVVGLVETHGRAATAAMVEGLEVVPRTLVTHRGLELAEMDLEGVLARAPQVALVDEPAHTNAPGSHSPCSSHCSASCM